MFLLDFAYNLEGHISEVSSVEEAHECIMREAGLLHDKSVRNIGSKGCNDLGWPVLEITFATKIKALRYTAAYMGVGHFSQDVIDYVQQGIQV